MRFLVCGVKKDSCSELMILRSLKLTGKIKKFDIYEHPLLAQRILKNGFSWPAFLVGPLWLLFRRVWGSAAVVVVIMVLLNFFNQKAEVPIFASFVCGMEVSVLPYVYAYDYDCVRSVRQWNDFFILLGVNFFIAVKDNEFWARDLITRGYVSVGSIEARSLDEVLAIIARSGKDLGDRRVN